MPRRALLASIAVASFVALGAAPVRASRDRPRPGHDRSAPATRPHLADFNGDGFADLAVGVPGESIGSVAQAGAANVLYGSATGLTSTGNQFWNQNSSGVPDSADTGDEFGFATVAGDFNGDGFADLAVGVPGEDFSGLTDAGVVEVLLGSSSGLTSTGAALWSEDTSGVAGSAASSDQFGASLAAGDLNGDGFADLVVGAPGKTVSSDDLAGAAIVLYGSTGGLAAGGSELWSQDSSGIPNAAETDDHFAFAVATGDFNGDGFDDLAAGVPGENANGGTVPDGGMVSVIDGSSGGLTSAGAQIWSLDSTGVSGSMAAQDDFGYSLATGDFNGDLKADLAIGIPFRDAGGDRDSGAVAVLYGSATGLSGTKSQLWALNSPSVPGALQSYASFGFDVTTANFDGDPYDDLAIGDPGEDINGHGRAGAVNVLYGRAAGLGSAGAQFWNQDSSGMAGTADTGDELGLAVAAGDVGNGAQGDLFAGAPRESIGSVPAAGSVNALYGSGTGVTSTGNKLWEQNSSGVADSCEPGDEFGFGVASGAHGP